MLTCASSLIDTNAGAAADEKTATILSKPLPSIVEKERENSTSTSETSKVRGPDQDHHPERIAPNPDTVGRVEETHAPDEVASHPLPHETGDETSGSLRSGSPSAELTAKVLSTSSVNEDDGTGDWSPEIPFRDLNDLRCSVDEEPSLVQQKVVESQAEDGAAAEQGYPYAPADHQPVVSSQLLHPQSNMSMQGHTTSERASLLPGASMAAPSEDPNSAPGMTVAEQVDLILDQYIEIESNKRMMKENVSWFCLTFKLRPMESKFHQVKDMVFKSNAVCVCVTWFFMMSSQVMILPGYVPLTRCAAFVDMCHRRRFTASTGDVNIDINNSIFLSIRWTPSGTVMPM